MRSNSIDFGVWSAENLFRHDPSLHDRVLCCIHPQSHPRSSVPLQWTQAGRGWVEASFVKEPESDAVWLCQVRGEGGKPCGHRVHQAPLLFPAFPLLSAYFAASVADEMVAHLVEVHGMSWRSPARDWSSGLFEVSYGCLEAVVCFPLIGSRQSMSLRGYSDRLNPLQAVLLGCLGFRMMCAGTGVSVAPQPAHCFAAVLTRHHVAFLQGIKEPLWCSSCIATVCAPCSLAQTQRELYAAGMDPGGWFFRPPPPRALE